MQNSKENKETSTTDAKYNNINQINKKKENDLSLLNLFNCNNKIPKNLKGDKGNINFKEFEKKLNASMKNNNLLFSQILIKNCGNILLNKNYNYNNKLLYFRNNNIDLNHSTLSTNKDLISYEDKNKKMILQKRFDKGNIALNTNQILNVKDINNPYIYSYIDWHPYSFCTGHRKWGYENGKLKSPSPILLDNEEWCKPKDLSKSEVLHGILIKDEVGLLLVDPFVCNKFSGMLGDLIKQILKVVFGHKISLNVKLFQPLSLSQTLLNYFSFIPKYILPSTNPNLSPIDRMKFAISLGIKGINTIDFFKINEKIYLSIPSSQIVNAIAKDDRSAHYVGVMIFYDIKNKLRAFVQFAKDTKHISDIRGYIFKYEFPSNYKFNFDKEYEMFNKIDTNNLNKNNNIFISNDILSTISGSWLHQLYFDGIKYWDIDEDIPTYIRPVYNCLPSDSRFREDLIWLYRSFFKSKNEEERLYYERLAQNWKLMIEKVQREERTLKAKLNEELAKKTKKIH